MAIVLCKTKFYVYNDEMLQENLNKRVSQYLNVPEKNIDSIQQELEKSIGE